MQKKIKKFFTIQIFTTTLILSLLIVLIKIYLPDKYEFIEPISIYWTILSSVIFIYWFILSPSISEYKESEKLLIDIKSSLSNIKDDAIYFKQLKQDFDINKFYETLSKWLNNFFHNIADNEDKPYLEMFEKLNSISLEWEKLWITANHIIRMKQELWILKKSFLRIINIKETDALPVIIHRLKNFITFMVIVTLIFLDITNEWLDFIAQIQESLILFLVSFLYIYLSFVISWFDNPFDKRRFSWFLDLTFIKDFSQDLKT